jgi:hypothetical protein
MGEGRKGGRRGRGEGSVALALLLDLARRSLRMLFVFFYFSIFLFFWQTRMETSFLALLEILIKNIGKSERLIDVGQADRRVRSRASTNKSQRRSGPILG